MAHPRSLKRKETEIRKLAVFYNCCLKTRRNGSVVRKGFGSGLDHVLIRALLRRTVRNQTLFN